MCSSDLGLLNTDPENDGIVRRVPSVYFYGDKLYPTLSIELMRVALGRTGVTVLGDEAGVKDVAIAPNARPQTDKNGIMWPYFSKHDQKKYIAAKDILNGSVDKSKIAGKIAIVGTSAVGLLDIKTIPTEAQVPGVEVHAQLIESVLTDRKSTRLNSSH